MLIQVSQSAFETIYQRVQREAFYYTDQAMLWFHRRSDGEQILLICLFILCLLWLIVRMSQRGKDPGSAGRQFGGSILLVMVFAFGVGWIIDSGAGSFSFLFQ